MSIVALIPARSGSKRIPNKNIKRLGKHPLIAYTIEQARQSGIFEDIVVSTDSPEYGLIANYYGAQVNARKKEYAHDGSPDIEWIKWTLNGYFGRHDYFAILRPTNPFRTSEMIQKAWKRYKKDHWMKGVERVSQHPEKMWNKAEYGFINNYVGSRRHDRQSNTLDEVYVQNGSIEIRPTDNLQPCHIQPYFTQGYEGYDLNTEKDWIYAEWLIEHGKVKLIDIDKEPYEDSCDYSPNILYQQLY